MLSPKTDARRLEIVPVPETAPIPTTELMQRPAAIAPFQGPSLAERMIRALEAHASAEAHDLANCQSLAERSDDQALRLLVSLIVDDEQRHHSLLQSMIRRLQETVDSFASPMSLPESESAGSSMEDPALVATLRSLIRDEHEAARHLRYLARQEPELYEGLYQVLLESVARDAEKHAAIFRYLLQRHEARLR
jgi:rubrerythrin